MSQPNETRTLHEIVTALQQNNTSLALELANERLKRISNESGESELGVVQTIAANASQVTTTVFEGIKGFAISASASAIGAIAVYPIDLVKTRMQAQRNSVDKRYANSFDCFKKVLRNEGFFAMYKGLVPNLLGQVPEKAMRLFIVNTVRGHVQSLSGTKKGEKPSRTVKYMAEIIAGASAGTFQVVITNPSEIVKVRMQVAGEAGGKKSIAGILRDLGFGGMYKGASACFLRDIPFSMLYFPIYAAGKELLTNKTTNYIGPFQLLLAGSFAGMVAAATTTPADVLKTRLQVETPPGQKPYTGLIDCFQRILQNEGPKALFKGIGPRIFRSSPQYGVMLVAYELLLRLFPNEQGEPEHVSPAQYDTVLGGSTYLRDKWMVMDSWVPPAKFIRGSRTFNTISVGGQGAVWGIDKNNTPCMWTGFDWHEIQGVSLKTISVGADGSAYGVDSDGNTYAFDPWNIRFNKVSSSPELQKVSVGNATRIWGLDSNNQVYKYEVGHSWKPRGDILMKHISVGADGTVCAVDKNGIPFKWLSDINKWSKFSDTSITLKQITVGSQNSIWGVDSNDELYKWSGQQWIKTDKRYGHVSAAADGTVVGILRSSKEK